MEKVIKDGKVAVVINSDYGIGWSTQTLGISEMTETLLFHPKIVEMVLEGKQRLITEEWLVENFGENYRNIFTGSTSSLEIRWLPIGTIFRVKEYDGAETIEVYNPKRYHIA